MDINKLTRFPELWDEEVIKNILSFYPPDVFELERIGLNILKINTLEEYTKVITAAKNRLSPPTKYMKTNYSDDYMKVKMAAERKMQKTTPPSKGKDIKMCSSPPGASNAESDEVVFLMEKKVENTEEERKFKNKKLETLQIKIEAEELMDVEETPTLKRKPVEKVEIEKSKKPKIEAPILEPASEKETIKEPEKIPEEKDREPQGKEDILFKCFDRVGEIMNAARQEFASSLRLMKESNQMMEENRKKSDERNEVRFGKLDEQVRNIPEKIEQVNHIVSAIPNIVHLNTMVAVPQIMAEKMPEILTETMPGILTETMPEIIKKACHKENLQIVQTYVCEKCPKIFRSEPSLKKHAGVVHDPVSTFKRLQMECGVKDCGLKSRIPSLMDLHRVKHPFLDEVRSPNPFIHRCMFEAQGCLFSCKKERPFLEHIKKSHAVGLEAELMRDKREALSTEDAKYLKKRWKMIDEAERGLGKAKEIPDQEDKEVKERKIPADIHLQWANNPSK